MAETELSDLKGDVRVLKSVLENGQKETSRRLDKIESKIDAQTSVSVGVFEEFKKEVKETYVTLDTFDPIKRLAYGLVGIVGTAIVLALIGGALKVAS